MNASPSTSGSEAFEMRVTNETSNAGDPIPSASLQRQPNGYFRRYCRWYFGGLLLVALGALVIVAGYIAWNYLASKPNDSAKKLADFYRQRVDPSYEPCTDFYKFACAKTTAKYRAQQRLKFDTAGELNEKALYALERLIRQPPNELDSQQLKEVKYFHQMCSDGETINEQGLAPLRHLIQSLGGWPILSGQKFGNETWEDVVESLNRDGFASTFPFKLSTLPYPRNVSVCIVRLMPFFHDERPLLLDFNRTSTYIKFLFGSLNGSNEKLNEDIDAFWNFESDLQKIVTFISLELGLYTVAELTTEFSGIRWGRFFETIFINTDIIMSESDPIVLMNPKSTPKIVKLLKETPVQTIRNYLVFRVVNEAVVMMNDEIRAERKIFLHQYHATTRSFDCVRLLNDKATIHTGQLYLEHVFNTSARSEAEKIFTDIRNHAHEYLTKFKWMNDKNIFQNLQDLQLIAGFDKNRIKTDEQLFKPLSFTRNCTAFDAYRELARFDRSFGYGMLPKALYIDNQSIVPYFALKKSYESFAHAPLKTLYIMPVILQSPIFHDEESKTIMYGGVGFVISHEITHGLKIIAACTKSTTRKSCERFKNYKNCMIDLYNNYTVEQINGTVNGSKTFEENIADVLGLQFAYYALEESMKKYNWTEPLLAELDYTPRQLFWIQAALTFCDYSSDDELRYQIKNDKHSVPEVRINVAFANIREFSRDFSCKVGSIMAPLNRCDFE